MRNRRELPKKTRLLVRFYWQAGGRSELAVRANKDICKIDYSFRLIRPQTSSLFARFSFLLQEYFGGPLSVRPWLLKLSGICRWPAEARHRPRPGSNSAHILSSRPDHKLFPHTLTRFFQRPAVARASSPCVAILYWGTLAYQEVPGFLACPQRITTL